MEFLHISGGKPLNGKVCINGSKNAALPVLPAAICAGGVCVIENLPPIADVLKFIDTLERLGAVCEMTAERTLRIDTSNIKNIRADFESVRDIRASYYLIGALLGMYGEAEVALPGGCRLGSRPYDYHEKGFKELGAEFIVEHGIMKAKAKKLVGTQIYLDFASVGATINLMLAAVYAEGVTVIENAAREPHVVDTANFLNNMGARIRGAGTNIIRITGVKHGDLHGPKKPHMLIPDQIEAGTFMIAAAATGGDVTVCNVIPKHMDPLSAKLREMGCIVDDSGEDFIRVAVGEKLRAVNVKTLSYPGFPTDLQPQMCALLSLAEGQSVVTETVHENRFQYVTELRRLGVKVHIEGRTAIIDGSAVLTGAQATATDLRAGAALVIAGLAAGGETIIGNVNYIERGYVRVDEKLRKLGADIWRQ